MVKTARKAVSVLLTALLCLGAVFSVAPSMMPDVAYAAQGDVVADGNLTVTGDQLAGKNVTAICMFTARATEGASAGSYNFDSYELEDAWLSFFQSNSIDYSDASITIEGGNSSADAGDALAYLQWLSQDENSTKVEHFADDAQDWARKNSTSLTGLTHTVKATASGDATKGSATFSNLTAGYYLVFPEGGGTGNDNRGTDAMLINVPTNGANATWNIKSVYPTVEKTVDTDGAGGNDFADSGSAQIGDTVTFKLTSTVPDMSDFDTYKFNFIDTMSNGLTFVKTAETVTTTDVTVTIGGRSVTTGYSVFLEGQKLTVSFNDLKSVVSTVGANKGDGIVVTYKAMINESAVSTNPVTNEAKVEYSNDPTTDTKGESTPDVSKVFTYKIDVNKWAKDAGGEDGNLAGAKFVLSTSDTAPTAAEIEGGLGNYSGLIKLIGSNESYRVAKPDEDDAVTSFTTTATGDITISGLEAGTYYLHEIEAPAGYNQLKDPIAIVITMTNAETGDATITVDGKGNDANSTVINVENKKGIELPTTGGMGTIGLTALGVIIVAAGAIWVVRRNRKGNQR